MSRDELNTRQTIGIRISIYNAVRAKSCGFKINVNGKQRPLKLYQYINNILAEAVDLEAPYPCEPQESGFPVKKSYIDKKSSKKETPDVSEVTPDVPPEVPETPPGAPETCEVPETSLIIPERTLEVPEVTETPETPEPPPFTPNFLAPEQGNIGGSV